MIRTLPLLVVAALLSACGGSGSSSTPVPSSSSASPGTTATAVGSAPATGSSPAPTAVPALPQTVWVVTTSGGVLVRAAPAAGGAFHTVATMPANTIALGAGGHWLLAQYPDNHLHGINLITGASSDFGGATGDTFFGGAISPDGRHAVYVRAVSPTSAGLRVLDLTTGTATQLHAYTDNNYSAPMVWNSTSIGATQIVGFADAGPQGFARLNPSDGSTIAATAAASAGGVIATDAMHAADAAHSALGDDADASGGPGPQGPFNTLRTITVGSAPVDVLQEAHHNIAVLAANSDGSSIVYFDDSAAGGYAGISASPDFGLFTWSAGHKTQLDHYGTKWEAAAFTSASTFVAAKQSGGSEVLVSVSGTTLSTIDTVSGDGATAVYSVSG